jgi:hypothetical protein
MKRLRDESGNSPQLRDAQRLLEAIEPLPESDERMQRVRRALDRPKRRAGGLRRVPALVLSGLVVLFGASAFAAVRYIAFRSAAVEQHAAPAGTRSRAKHERAVQPTLPAPEPAAPANAAPAIAPVAAPRASPATEVAANALPAVAPNAVPADRVNAPVPAPSPSQPDHAGAPPQTPSAAPRYRRATWAETERPEHSAAPRTRAGARAARARQPAAEARALAQEGAADSATESGLVHRAVQALRRDGDPALAARLLAESRKHSANGPLAEEALSLQIEAASALGDGRARSFAREYLARYPTGRYASMARDALRAR